MYVAGLRLHITFVYCLVEKCMATTMNILQHLTLFQILCINKRQKIAPMPNSFCFANFKKYMFAALI